MDGVERGETPAGECDAPPRPEQGWTRRFTAVGGRLAEMAELYRALGYEVRLGPPDDGDEQARPDACAGCVVMTLARTVYTRRAPRRPGPAAPGEQKG